MGGVGLGIDSRGADTCTSSSTRRDVFAGVPALSCLELSSPSVRRINIRARYAVYVSHGLIDAEGNWIVVSDGRIAEVRLKPSAGFCAPAGGRRSSALASTRAEVGELSTSGTRQSLRFICPPPSFTIAAFDVTHTGGATSETFGHQHQPCSRVGR